MHPSGEFRANAGALPLSGYLGCSFMLCGSSRREPGDEIRGSTSAPAPLYNQLDFTSTNIPIRLKTAAGV